MRLIVRPWLFGALVAAALTLASCSLPRAMGLGGYYQVTDAASGKVYFADELTTEDRGAVEFRDGVTGAWISLASADYKAISEADYRAGIRP
jgi:hypothetical protein